MRKFRRPILKTILILSTVLALYITYTAYSHREWATVASALTVITGVLAIWSSLNLTWKQEDDKEPYINIYIESKTHKYAYNLVIENTGGTPAYNIQIEWTKPLLDFKNELVKFCHFGEEYDILYLPPGKSYSAFMTGSDDMIQRFENATEPLLYSGKVSFSYSFKSKYRAKYDFKVSFEHLRRSLNVLDDQMDFYFENKSLSKKLASLEDVLKDINKNLMSKD